MTSQGKIMRPDQKRPSPSAARPPIANDVRCVNKFDIRPAVKGMMQSVESAWDNAAPGQPVVVTIGEGHDRMIDPSLQQGFLRALQAFARSKDTTLALGLEIAFSTLDLHLGMNLDIPPVPGGAYRVHDPYGRHTLKTMLAFPSTTEDQPVAQANLRAFAHTYFISACFNDLAATRVEPGIRAAAWAVPFTAHILSQMGLTPNDHVPMTSSYGVTLRNLAITQNIMHHMQQIGARLYLQIAGDEHIAPSKNFDPTTSLPVLLDQEGCVVVPVLNRERRLADATVLPPEILARSAFVSGLYPRFFSRKNDPAEMERKIIERVIRESGGAIGFEETSAHPDIWLRHITRVAPMWHAKADAWAQKQMANRIS